MPIPSSANLANLVSDYLIYRPYAGKDSLTSQLQAHFNYAVTWSERFCNRSLFVTSPTTVTETVNGYGTATIVIKNTPVTSITTIYQVMDDSSTVLVDSTTYRLTPNTGEIQRIPSITAIQATPIYSVYGAVSSGLIAPSFNWAPGNQNYQVTYVYGATSYYGTNGTQTDPAADGLDFTYKYALFRMVDRLRGLTGQRDANYRGRTDADDANYFSYLFTPFRSFATA